MFHGTDSTQEVLLLNCLSDFKGKELRDLKDMCCETHSLSISDEVQNPEIGVRNIYSARQSTKSQNGTQSSW